jgi:hypothetical protein
LLVANYLRFVRNELEFINENSGANGWRRGRSLMFMTGPARSASKQLDELLHSQAGVGDNATEGTGADLLVIGNDDSRVRLVATELM